MFARIASILFVVGLLLVAVPARAVEPVTSLPPINPVTSGRFDFALAINQQVFGYGQGEFVGTSAHAVFVDAQRNHLIEVVISGDRLYLRQGVEPRWLATALDAGALPVSGPAAPMLPITGAQIVQIGNAEVAGTSTMQYQIMLDPAQLAAAPLPGGASMPAGAGITAAKIDLFVGTNDNYLRKVQVTVQSTEPQLGEVTLELAMVFSALNEPVVVGPPPANLVDELPTRAASRYHFAGTELLPSWSRPFFAHGLTTLQNGR